MILYVESVSGTRTTSVEVDTAFTFFQRLKGLLGTASIAENKALWIKPCTSIHMFGMLYAIDVVFLDADNVIKKIARNVMPFGFSNGPKDSESVLEMKKGSAERLQLSVGNRLVIE